MLMFDERDELLILNTPLTRSAYATQAKTKWRNLMYTILIKTALKTSKIPYKLFIYSRTQ